MKKSHSYRQFTEEETACLMIIWKSSWHYSQNFKLKQHNCLFCLSNCPTTKRVNWYDHLEKLSANVYIRCIKTLKMFTLFDPVVLGNYFKCTLQNEGSFTYDVVHWSILYDSKIFKITHNYIIRQQSIETWTKEVNRYFTKEKCVQQAHEKIHHY